ncbi:hypothetical protein MKX64_08570 [Paenibacillus sp. FSL M8-0334]|uniref:hypothetical protein n=1 Tax=Paenibacillus sp. FSL M8-0334 TaxID=2921623 RepID=UPI0030FA728E
MNRNAYKKLMDHIEPDEGVKKRMMERMNKGKVQSTRWSRRAVAMVSLAAVLGLGAVVTFTWERGADDQALTAVKPEGTGQHGSANPSEVATEPVTIPQVELPGDNGIQANMIGLVVYQGNIYTQSSTRITPEAAEQLLGDKLGRSKAGITEWSDASDYTELASTIGETDIYAVKGYDTDFRIMSYQVIDGQVYAEFYDHLNGIAIATGEDLIGKLNVKDRIQTAQWQSFDSWNMGENRLQAVQAADALSSFVTALHTASPVAEEALGEEPYASSEQKFLYLKLEDETEVELRLFKLGSGNYAKYGHTPVFLQVEDAVFNALWDSME